jgi:MFS family permease
MFTGRLIFGYGSESLTAAQNVYITHYFHNEKLAFPISIGNAVALFGTYLNYSLTAEIARKYGLKFGFLSGMFFCMISLLAIILTITIDFFIEKSLKNPQEIATSSDEVEILIKPEILLNSEEKSVFSRFSASFWILLFSSVIVYASSIGFSSIAVSYFVESYFPKVDLKTAEIESTRIMSLDSLTNIFSSIFLAIFMHYTSSNFLYIFPTINSIISLIAFTMLLLTIFPFLTLILDGLASSLNYNILNTMIPRMVKEKDLGLAYCMAAAGNNLGTSLIPIIAAFLRNARDNYDMAIGLFILLNVGSLISAMMFYFQYKEKLLKEKEEANY